MPLAPTPIAAVPSKPKIGFSIDSIVGGGTRTQSASPRSDGENSNQSVMSESPVSSPIQREEGHHRTTVHSPPHHGSSPSPSLSPATSPTLDPGRTSPGPPTIIRPSALPPGALPPFSKSSLYHLPEHLVHGHHHPLALAAAAAQHFQAAGLAAALGNGSFLPPGGPQGPNPNGTPPGGPQLLPPAHHPHQPPPRDTYPLYPWLLSRHGRIFPHRFPGGESIRFLTIPSRLP